MLQFTALKITTFRQLYGQAAVKRDHELHLDRNRRTHFSSRGYIQHMEKHILFLLLPGFTDNAGGPFFCPECAMVEGFLRYAPEVESQLVVHRIAFPRPRGAVIEQLGEPHQGCPVLILHDSAEIPETATRSEHTGKAFIAGPVAVCDYLAGRHGVARPHP